MSLLKRFGFFLFGLSIGILFLTFFLKKKSQGTGMDFCYLPNCRVLKNIRSKPLSYSDAIQKKIRSKELDSTDIDYFLYNGDVDFGKSDTASDSCKTYVIAGTINNRESVLKVRNCTENAVVESLELGTSK